ncbi:hypothetical protein JCM12298_03520 [Desulfothermus naphthae]
MSISTEELMSMIDYLPIDIKTQLVERILTSLQPIQKDIDAFWAEEAEKRINEIKEKKVKLIEAEEVFNEIKKIIGQ